MLHYLRKPIGKILLKAAFALFLYPEPGGAVSSPATNWRFFAAPDGLVESWSSFITVGSSGRVWVSHGGVERISWLEGYPGPDGRFVHSIPNPGDDLKVYESNCGQLWSLYSNGIQQFEDGEWVRYKIDEIKNLYPADIIVRPLIPFLPGEKDQCYYLMPESLKLFNAATGGTELIKAAEETNLGSFIDMTAARDGGIWITGELGGAKLIFEPGTLAPQWREYLVRGLGVRELDKPFEGENGELLAVARSVQDNETRLLHFDGVKWNILPGYEGTVVRAWPGLENSFWISKEKNTISLIESGREEVQDKVGILAGDLFDVTVEPNGIFWLATSHGLARYSPSVWRTPGEIKEIKDRIHAIHEDPEGRIWFAAVYHLLLFQNGRWKKYTLPEGLETQLYFIQSICSLPDGRIAIGTIPYHDYLLTFDPEKERFEFIDYVPQDTLLSQEPRVIGLVSPLKDRTVMVQTLKPGDTSIFRLEIFDGKTFKPFLDMGDKWNLGNLRYIYEAANGDLWIGGQAERSLAVYRNGEYKSFIDDEGYAGTGGFCIGEVEEGKIWIGGRDDILEYDGKSWRNVLSNLSSVRSIATGRDGSVWVASGTGIHRRFNGSWVTNTAEDGLANTAVFQVYQDSRGRVWAGTISGLSLYNPEADVDPPQTIISEMENLKETPPAGEVRLIFSGMDKWQQTLSERLLFSYRLDNGPWSPFRNSNVALFDNLPCGGHLFEVRAMDTNLNYDPQPAAFEFIVILPWYKETGFQALSLIAAAIISILLGYAVYRHVTLEKIVVKRTSDLRNANVQLEDKISELKRAETQLLETQKMEIIGKIASGVAHEVRNPLNAILVLSESLFQEFHGDPEFKPYMDNISIQVDRLAILMNDLLELGKPIEKNTFVRTSLYEICSGTVELWLQSTSNGGRKVRLLCPQGDRRLDIIANG
ncbi:MAG: two-component regulator propeller domain-containing protein, partial [Gemmatimonadota bacterium]|nr:two-component regulator propeller domain-containing protein [Gemmatimonadota bacterium]